jgi:hypothetical protein
MPYGGVALKLNSERAKAHTRKCEQCFVKMVEIVHGSEGVCGSTAVAPKFVSELSMASKAA